MVTSESATIGLPEVDVGLLGGGRHAQRMFGVYKARMLMFTGQRVTGAELYRRAIVEQCVPPERLMDAAMEIAANIAEKSPLTIRMAKKNMATVEFMNIRDGYRYEQDGTNALLHSEDSKEAVRAFLEDANPYSNRLWMRSTLFPPPALLQSVERRSLCARNVTTNSGIASSQSAQVSGNYNVVVQAACSSTAIKLFMFRSEGGT